MARNSETLAHQEWLGFIQPVGLVVSIPALVNAQAFVNRNIVPKQMSFLNCLLKDENGETIPELSDFRKFTRDVLDWETEDLVPVENESSFEVFLPEYQESIKASFGVPLVEKDDDDKRKYQVLIKELPSNQSFDETHSEGSHKWQASSHAKFERLLREVEIPIGLLHNNREIRLIYAPRGETSGYLTFSIEDMTKVAGRPLLSAFHMLLSSERLFTLPKAQRLPEILDESRRYQSTVSTQLAEQVLTSLYELLRGFQAANEKSKGELLQKVLERDPNEVYEGLLTVLMRLVFVLYAEDRGLISNSSVYSKSYSVYGLFEKLREDAGRYPDTMDHRYGSWAQLLCLFRLIFEGGKHGDFSIPARQGHLFDVDRYMFLEGRDGKTSDSHLDIPLVPDGVIYRVLSNLLVLDGERLSYRTLDVEQIGSVYETIMGFRLEVAKGRSIAIKPKKTHGAPTTVNLDELLLVNPSQRVKWFAEKTELNLKGSLAKEVKIASSIEELMTALEKKVAKKATPNIVPKGNMILQPSDERRRSGSHYTPRTLTEPIVRAALKPVLDNLGRDVKSEQILDLKICDPAMGSGAFLVEACRQLGDELVKSWHNNDCLPEIPSDEDEVLHARRLIAQQCLYGVDKNEMAVSLSKLSVWLATLAKDHPFTFLDHNFRCGDSLVGLNRDEISKFNWIAKAQKSIDEDWIKKKVDEATRFRKEILANAEHSIYRVLHQLLKDADCSLEIIRAIGNAAMYAFFSTDTDRKREERRLQLLPKITELVTVHNRNSIESINDEVKLALDFLKKNDIETFHWSIEFPEVFDRKNGGFDVIIGNPPFAGKNTLSKSQVSGYSAWLKSKYKDSHGNSDLVAFFFREAFNLLRTGGCMGLIATNTIGQGDTRSTGLSWICKNHGVIYQAVRRFKWPGVAAVVVSTVHITKGSWDGDCVLDQKTVPRISAYLFHTGPDDDPEPIKSNEGISFIGPMIFGAGFTFDDSDKSGKANSLQKMKDVIEKDAKNKELIYPYIGGEEILQSPTQTHSRYVFGFGDMTESEARKWPDLIGIVEDKVKPERMKLKDNADGRRRKEFWWQWGRYTPSLDAATSKLERMLVHPFTSKNLAFAFLSTSVVVGAPHPIIALSDYGSFGILQSSIHETWARFFASSMKDDLRYTPTACFRPFPFPVGYESDESLSSHAQSYYKYRARLMCSSGEGLTKIYNRFHDPEENDQSISKLRELHSELDRQVLLAYGWGDLEIEYAFLLDYEDEADSAEDETRVVRRKKPWRYRWVDKIRDEVLGRLLDLNNKLSKQQTIDGVKTKKRKTKAVNSPGDRNKNKVTRVITVEGMKSNAEQLKFFEEYE